MPQQKFEKAHETNFFSNSHLYNYGAIDVHNYYAKHKADHKGQL